MPSNRSLSPPRLPGMGMQDNLQMHMHHSSTISLLLISFLLNLHRSGA